MQGRNIWFTRDGNGVERLWGEVEEVLWGQGGYKIYFFKFMRGGYKIYFLKFTLGGADIRVVNFSFELN